MELQGHIYAFFESPILTANDGMALTISVRRLKTRSKQRTTI